ncbi:DUF4850 domain-containing protein [Paenibacillus sp. XY044]|uniref:DUF4850 domain-containing protein n=1 Tax=Paenibacillus sp. XY044 TaxID=2026089 RepID=UPI000B99AC8C|nr:DUF4850 domain-containing protein [Paenibacillus sp. XY044]OZB90712.1 hypothetical protein CJP46_31860 [Paenibacillus sp. XY044]
MRRSRNFIHNRKLVSVMKLLLVCGLIVMFTTSLFQPKYITAVTDGDRAAQADGTDKGPAADQGTGSSGSGTSGQQQGAGFKPSSVQCGVMKLRHGTQEAQDQQIPLYCIEGNYNVGDPPMMQPANPLQVKTDTVIPEKVLSGLGAFWLSDQSGTWGHLLLAPRHWEVVRADTGANGSVGLELADPLHPDRRAVYLDGGPCQGCNIALIGSYFTALKNWAEEMGFPGKPMKFLHHTYVRNHVVTYVLPPGSTAYKTVGAAFERHEPQDAMFTRYEISVPPEDMDMANVMLDFFARFPSSVAADFSVQSYL